MNENCKITEPMHFWTFALLRTFCILYHVLTQEEIESYKLSLKDEKHRFPGDPRKHVGNCGRFGASPGGRPYKFCGGRPGPGPGVLLERFLPNCDWRFFDSFSSLLKPFFTPFPLSSSLFLLLFLSPLNNLWYLRFFSFYKNTA